MRVIVADAERNLVYDTAMGSVESPSELLAAGALGSQVDNAVTREPLTTAGRGPATVADPEGRPSLGGFDILDDCLIGGARGAPTGSSPQRRPRRALSPRSPTSEIAPW